MTEIKEKGYCPSKWFSWINLGKHCYLNSEKNPNWDETYKLLSPQTKYMFYLPNAEANTPYVLDLFATGNSSLGFNLSVLLTRINPAFITEEGVSKRKTIIIQDVINKNLIPEDCTLYCDEVFFVGIKIMKENINMFISKK